MHQQMNAMNVLSSQEVLCPYTHGEGVYIARSLLAAIYPDSVFSHFCESDPSFEIRSTKVDVRNTVLKVFPNPANDVLYINMLNYNSDEKAVIEIADLLGRRILSSYTTLMNMNSMDVSSLKNGCYMLKITLHSGKLLTEKICIVR